ncbi:MAG: hypothetical protein MUO54_06855 [Anaerolineales bacterium]|nr:hypothetical protein [Anaerolineales bacterium]
MIPAGTGWLRGPFSLEDEIASVEEDIEMTGPEIEPDLESVTEDAVVESLEDVIAEEG